MTFSVILRRLVMFTAICQLLSFVLLSSLVPTEPQVYYGPLVDGFVKPLFVVFVVVIDECGDCAGTVHLEEVQGV